MNPNTPARVSVVIPCFNQAHFLEEAIRSALRQTMIPAEIIVVDDGSTDETGGVCKRFEAVHCLRQSNGGPASARNCGLLQATGEYIVFLDADDRLLPNAIEVGLESMCQGESFAFVSGNVQLISTDGLAIEIPPESCVNENHYSALLCSNYVWTPAAVLFKTELVRRNGGFDVHLFGTEDWDLLLRLAREFEVFCHHTVIAEHRIHEHKLTTNSARMLSQSIAALRKQLPYVKMHPEYQGAYRRGIQEVQKYWGRPLIEGIHRKLISHHWLSAIKDLCVLLRYHPSAIRKWNFRTGTLTES